MALRRLMLHADRPLLVDDGRVGIVLVRVEGRAFVGQPYINPYIAFHVSNQRADGSTLSSMEGIRSNLLLTARQLPPVALIDVGRIVSDVLLTPNGETLIVIDAAASSLAQYAVNPLARQATVQ